MSRLGHRARQTPGRGCHIRVEQPNAEGRRETWSEVSAWPLACPLTSDTLPAPCSLPHTREAGPSNVVLWLHESPSCRPSSRKQPLSAAQPVDTVLRPSSGAWGRWAPFSGLPWVLGVGWAARRGGPCWGQVCPTQLPGSPISQHQQLLPRTRGTDGTHPRLG